MLNKVMNDFGLEIKMSKGGNASHRTYSYTVQRLPIIEDYLLRLEKKELIDM